MRVAVLKNEDEGDDDDAGGHAEHVVLDGAGLKATESARAAIEERGGEVDQAIDDVAIEQVGDGAFQFGQRADAVDDAVDHLLIEFPKQAADRQKRSDDERVVNLIDPKLAVRRHVKDTQPVGKCCGHGGVSDVEEVGDRRTQKADQRRERH